MSPALTADKVPALVAKGVPASRNAPSAPKFRVGQRIRARNINPDGHTRLPRYARGKLGTIERDHGVFVFPDTNAHSRRRNRSTSTRCASTRASYGANRRSPQDSVYVDLWDDHLEPA